MPQTIDHRFWIVRRRMEDVAALIQEFQRKVTLGSLVQYRVLPDWSPGFDAPWWLGRTETSPFVHALDGKTLFECNMRGVGQLVGAKPIPVVAILPVKSIAITAEYSASLVVPIRHVRPVEA